MSADELTTGQWKVIVKGLHEAGAAVMYILGGEPTLRRDLPEIISYSHGLGIAVALSTNGYSVTNRYAELLREAGLGEAQVSIDAPDERLNDYLRGAGSTRAAISAAKNLKNAGVRLTVSVTVSDINYNMVDGMLALAENLGAEAINFIAVQPFGRAKEKGLMLSRSNAGIVLKTLFKYNGSLRVTANGFRFFLSYEDAQEAASREDLSCPAGESYIAVGPDGTVYGCDLLMALKSGAGNALANGIKYIMRHGFASLKARRNVNFQPCATCQIRGSCQGGCAARALQKYGTVLAKDPLCPIGMPSNTMRLL